MPVLGRQIVGPGSKAMFHGGTLLQFGQKLDLLMPAVEPMAFTTKFKPNFCTQTHCRTDALSSQGKSISTSLLSVLLRIVGSRLVGYPENTKLTCRASQFAKLVCLVLALTVFLPQSSWADQIPHTAYRGPIYFVSKDMDLLTIDFVVRPWEKDVEDSLKRTVRIPRAFVNFVVGYSHKPAGSKSINTPKSRMRGWETLPSAIRSSKIMVSLADPEGSPYSLASASWGKLGAVKDVNGVKFRRAHSMFANMRFSKDAEKEPYWLRRAREKNTLLSEYDGFLYDPTVVTGHFYYNIGSGSLKSVRCPRVLRETLPSIYCTYTVNLGENFLADISFLDFRLHGGRQYIVERVGVFLRSMCRYFPCDKDNLVVLAHK